MSYILHSHTVYKVLMLISAQLYCTLYALYLRSPMGEEQVITRALTFSFLLSDIFLFIYVLNKRRSAPSRTSEARQHKAETETCKIQNTKLAAGTFGEGEAEIFSPLHNDRFLLFLSDTHIQPWVYGWRAFTGCCCNSADSDYFLMLKWWKTHTNFPWNTDKYTLLIQKKLL